LRYEVYDLLIAAKVQFYDSFLVVKVTISLCVNRQILEVDDEKDNATLKRTIVFTFSCSGPNLRGLQQAVDN